jgi:hypothetical protein
MIRTLNFAFIAITGLVCLGLYRIAEDARIAAADLHATRAAIVSERDALAVLGAEWASITQPGRIQTLTQRHLNLSDKPAVELSSLTALPAKNPPLVPDSSIRNVNSIVPIAPAAIPPATGAALTAPQELTPPTAAASPEASFAAARTGT